MNLTFEHLKWIRQADHDELVDLALRMIVAHPDTFDMLIQVGPRRFTAKWENGGSVSVLITNDQLIEFRQFKAYNDKIPCIKKIREIYSIGLKEAKELSENQDFMKAIGAGWICPATNTTIDGKTPADLDVQFYGRRY